jgi:CheY-like chemotaxis protein
MESGQTKPFARPVTPSASRPILLAGANREDEELFRRALRKAGFQNPVHAVHTGDEAISYLSGEGQYADRARFPTPHLLLLDPNIPGKDGWEVLRWVREGREFSAVAIVIFGGSGSALEEYKAHFFGANAYHPKPSMSEEFDTVVKQIAECWLLPGIVL